MNLRDEIARREKICEAAIKGPWKGGGPTFDTIAPPHFFGSVHWEDGFMLPELRGTTTFIAHARTGYPEVLAALADAVAALEELDEDYSSSVAERALAQIAGRLGHMDVGREDNQ